jgi:hypothetical protein
MKETMKAYGRAVEPFTTELKLPAEKCPKISEIVPCIAIKVIWPISEQS